MTIQKNELPCGNANCSAKEVQHEDHRDWLALTLGMYCNVDKFGSNSHCSLEEELTQFSDVMARFTPFLQHRSCSDSLASSLRFMLGPALTIAPPNHYITIRSFLQNPYIVLFYHTQWQPVITLSIDHLVLSKNHREETFKLQNQTYHIRYLCQVSW